ncbi:MAG: hypothetical protein U5N86_02015 [Planctomycetota bacterium]|nr:hypothetical protein [Planctomycetota bacterium]
MCHKKNELIRGLEQKAEKLLTLSGIEPRQHYENYRGLAGYVCVWVPPELFAAAGYHPFLLRSGKPLASLIKKDDNRCLNCIALESFFADEVPKGL